MGTDRLPESRRPRASSKSGDEAPAFVGRTEELARLAALRARTGDNRGGIALLVGEAGIGKSALIATAACGAAGLGVFSAVADEVERRRPFGVAVDALEVRSGEGRVRRRIVRLLDEHRPRGAGFGLEARIVDLLVAIAAQATDERGVVIALDDLQWADEASLMAIKGLARLTHERPLLLICALRPYPHRRALRALLAALAYHDAERIELAGLSEDEVAALAVAVSGSPPDRAVLDALAAAAGNPFYVSELLRSAADNEATRVAPDGTLALTGAGLAPVRRARILERLWFLPDETLVVLRTAAVLGGSFSPAEIALLSPTTVADVIAALRPAEESGLLVSDGARLRFRHDLIREAIYEDMSPAATRGLHRELAARLAAAGAPSQRIAAQLMLGAEPGDREAVAGLRAAAADVLSSSPAIAADLLNRAAELAPNRDELRMGVLIDLVRPLMWTGQAARVEEVCREALDCSPPPAEEPLFWLGLVNAEILQGRLLQAKELIARAERCVSLTESDRLHLRAAAAFVGIHLGDAAALADARDIAANAPTSIPRGLAQEALAQWELFTGHADRALALFETVDAVRAPAELESRIWQGSGIRVRIWEAAALLHLDRPAEAVEILADEIAGKLSVIGLPHALKAACHYHQAEFEAALRECDAAAAAADTSGSFTPALAPAIAARIAIHQGRLDDAAQQLETAERLRGPTEFAGGTLARWVRVLLHEAIGETDLAADAAADALTAYRQYGFASYLAWHAPTLTRVALAAGRRQLAQQVVAAAEAAAAQLPVASRRAAALRARGLLQADTAVLLEAVVAAREAPRPVDLALTLRDAAAASAADRDRAAAKELGREALQILGGLRAEAESRRSRQLLRDAGLRLSARSRHTTDQTGWDSLTRTELQITSLAADGRSNQNIAQRLFISPRTVGWHLSNVYAKLGVSSRAELAAATNRRHDS